MGKVPVLKPREVVGILESLGFPEARQRGSHKQYRHPDGRCTAVPFHQGRDLSPILLRQIVKDIDMTMDGFLRRRQRVDGGEELGSRSGRSACPKA